MNESCPQPKSQALEWMDMKSPGAPILGEQAKRGTHLLGTINKIRTSVGEGLNEDELTLLLWQKSLPAEAGFSFLSLCDGMLTLAVPHQDTTKWYPEKGWVAQKKESIARALASKYGLSLCEPPDTTPSSYWSPERGFGAIHHHLELSDGVESIIVAHPCYLKIRLFGGAAGVNPVRQAHPALPLSPELLSDLAALYQP